MTCAQMVMILRGRSKCPLCDEVLAEKDSVIAFPAFIPRGHQLSSFSDAAFHLPCFQKHEDADDVVALYNDHRRKRYRGR